MGGVVGTEAGAVIVDSARRLCGSRAPLPRWRSCSPTRSARSLEFVRSCRIRAVVHLGAVPHAVPGSPLWWWPLRRSSPLAVT